MKLIPLLAVYAILALHGQADLVLEAASTAEPYRVKISILNKGEEAVKIDFPSPERYPAFKTWSPFHWRIQSDKSLPLNKGPFVPKQGEWSTTHVISSNTYSPGEWDALFDSKILAPSERITYNADLREMMPCFDWKKAKGEVVVEFRYPGKKNEKVDYLESKPLKIRL